MRLLAAAALLALCLPATARPPAEGGRPRVGLVLSGGGARGAAHVGVLKVLEELHVPVDVVAGTSMGSIVGGLYATGMSPAEMERVLAEMDWDDAFDDDVPRAELPIRRKEERDIFRVGIALGFRGGKLGLPSGLVAGQKLNYILRTLTLPSALVRDFDRLPIPFRTVGTDAANGHRVVLRKGDVAEAIRASMAFPGLFAPVEIDGRLLVDGGVAENFPVQTAREAGAQKLIAVDISAPPVGKEELGDLVKILGQVTSMATSLNVERSRKALGPDDVFIEPQLGTLSFLDFDKASEAVALGEQAARAAADRLRAFSVPDAEWEAWLARTRRKPQPPMQIALVRVVNTSRLSDAAVLERVRSRSGPLDLEVLRADLGRIYALQQFDLVDFRFVEERGENVLEIVTEERAWGYTRMRFALDLKTDLKGDSSFQFDVGLIRTSINRLGGEWRLMAGVGATEWLGAELYQPVVPSGALFVAPSVSWRTDRVEIPILDSSLFADYRKRVLAGNLDLGLALDPLAELRLGLERGYLWADPHTGSELPVERQDRGAVLARAIVDSRDDESFPRSGALLASQMRWESHRLGGRDSFRRLEAIGVAAFSLGDNTLQLVAQGGSPLGTELEYFDQFFLGGFRHLSGYRPNELSGPYCAFASVSYLRALGGRVPFLGGELFAGAGLEAGNAWENGADVSVSDLKTSVTLFAGTRTLLGPLQIGLGLAGGGRSVVYLNLGRTF